MKEFSILILTIVIFSSAWWALARRWRRNGRSALLSHLGAAVSGFVISSIFLFVAVGVLTTQNQNPAPATTSSDSQSNADVSTPRTTEATTSTVELTGPQSNAVRSAKQYLSFKGFSRKGLIQQLSSDAGDGYKIADATAAVDSLNVDWNQEAEESAKQYLSMQGFSCKGLIQQLSSSAGDGYTTSQATYGAKQAGACQ